MTAKRGFALLFTTIHHDLTYSFCLKICFLVQDNTSPGVIPDTTFSFFEDWRKRYVLIW
jgi:hypothetical protein